MTHRALLLVLLIISLGACSAPAPMVELRGERFIVEIVDDDRSRQRGMMFRDELAADAGMLFVFPREGLRSFWMRNCRINLDILYFDAQLQYVSGHFDVPPCNRPRCPSYPSEGPARYVLELNGGTAELLGVAPGDRLTLEL